jgi:Ras homolog gene family, member A
MDRKIENQNMELSLWDTAGQEDWDPLRPLTYPETHAFLICFSVDDQESFENTELKWVPEISHFCPGVPFILVGCKTDLRRDRKRTEELMKQGKNFISSEEGKRMASKIGARVYLECSSKREEGVEQVFRTAAAITLTSTPEEEHKTCLII